METTLFIIVIQLLNNIKKKQLNNKSKQNLKYVYF